MPKIIFRWKNWGKTLSDTLLITKIAQKQLPCRQTPSSSDESEVLLIAILSDTHASELRIFPMQEPSSSLVGNIYIGKVRKVQKNIAAAFIEIAGRQQCYYSISDNPSPFYTKKGNSKNITEGDELVVQVIRDGMKTKLPAITSKLEFPGHYLILVTDNGRLGISSKISGEDRKRLREWLSPFITEQYGFIVRTNAVEATLEEIEAEAHSLREQYETLMHNAPHRTCFSLLKGPLPAWLAILRDIYTANLTSVVTDILEVHASIQEYMKLHQPEMLEKLRLYQDDLLSLPKLYSLERELTLALREQVWLKSGAYLVIQPTEALTVIDVNTGKFSEKKARRETLLKTNLEAAAESARQIRLRNLSGIILIDFINMENKEDQEELLRYLEKLLQKDPVRTRLIDMTKLELVEITRQKVRKTLFEQLKELENR